MIRVFHTTGTKQTASISVPKSIMGLHKFCPSVVQSLLCLQLFLKKIKTRTRIVSVVFAFCYAEVITQSWLLSACFLKVSAFYHQNYGTLQVLYFSHSDGNFSAWLPCKKLFVCCQSNAAVSIYFLLPATGESV